MKTTNHLPRLAIVGIGYLVSLAATFMVVSRAVWQYDVVSPTMSAAALMLFFGPFLPADGLEYPQFFPLETCRMPDSIGQDAFSEVK